MTAARKTYVAPLTVSTPGRRQTTKKSVTYYTYDDHGEVVEVAYRPATRAVRAQLDLIGGR